MSAFLSILRRAPVLVGVTMTLALGGCGSIVHGTTQQVSLSSSPMGASITVNGRPLGTTPAAVDLQRKDSHVIRIELDGYQPYEVALTRSVSGWVWGNIVFGGLLGLAIDARTGGLYKLSPEQVMASLAREAPALWEFDDDQLYVMVTLSPLAEWHLLDYLQQE